MPLIRRAQSTFQRFVESEASGGLVLMVGAAIGMAVANSVLAGHYGELLHTKIGGLHLLHWINDGLMSLFFLLSASRSSARCSWASSLLGHCRHRRHARPGTDLFGRQLAKPGDVARVGYPDRHRHCLCARRALAVRLANSKFTQGIPDLPGSTGSGCAFNAVFSNRKTYFFSVDDRETTP